MHKTLSAIANNAERTLVIVSDVVLAAAASPAVHALPAGVAAAVIGAQHIALVVLAGLSAVTGVVQAPVAAAPAEVPAAPVAAATAEVKVPLDTSTPAAAWDAANIQLPAGA